LSIHLNDYLKYFRAILHDPELYPDPEEFKPERFLNEDGTIRDDPTLSLVFGAGKRICPGRHFVDATIFIVTSSVLSVFNVMKAKDENGHEIPVKVVVSAQRGVVMSVQILRLYYFLKLRVRFSRRSEKFECSILPRDKVAEDLVSANALV
jgi:TATA-box binding protein (TBP) (component of TFIID and TFIIIB)